MTCRVLQGDCIEAMAAMGEASVDAICTDPPYGIGFMGKEWDAAAGPGDHPGRRTAALDAVNAGNARQGGRQRAGVDYQRRQARDARAFQEWCGAWAAEALRVLKPGGHLLAFGGTRTYHRLTCAIEDAGFEVRDCLTWMYGSGFPKSLDVSKAIDKAAGAEREIVGPPRGIGGRNPEAHAPHENYGGLTGRWAASETAPATPDAERWQGWGTALKPAHEPIVLARKPLTGTVAGNVLAHGTGALNVDGCRLGTDEQHRAKCESVVGLDSNRNGAAYGEWKGERESSWTPGGRWPANVLLDSEAAAMLDEQTGELHSQDPATRMTGQKMKPKTPGVTDFATGIGEPIAYADTGGASRFFYVAKASSAERNAGLDGFEASGDLVVRTPGTKWCRVCGKQAVNVGTSACVCDAPDWTTEPQRRRANVHPTVKPIDLMRWLCRLVTPPGGVVLDPFTGSGTTGCAAVLERFDFVGIEREPEYLQIAEARIRWWAAHPDGVTLVRRLEAESERKAAAARGQDSLFDMGEAAA